MAGSAMPFPNSTILPLGATPGQDKGRQEAAHAHHATPSPNNRFVYINDLGLDCIHIYQLDATTAKLTANDPPEWKDAAGAGPRVLRFHPSGRWAYCVNELSSTVDLLSWNPANGALTQVQETKLLPEDHTGVTRAAEIIFDAKGEVRLRREPRQTISSSLSTSIQPTESSHRRCGRLAEAEFLGTSRSIPPSTGSWLLIRSPMGSQFIGAILRLASWRRQAGVSRSSRRNAYSSSKAESLDFFLTVPVRRRL